MTKEQFLESKGLGGYADKFLMPQMERGKLKELLQEYANLQKPQLNIPIVANRYYFDCWKRGGKLRSRAILVTSEEDAIAIFKSKYPDMNFDRPFI